MPRSSHVLSFMFPFFIQMVQLIGWRKAKRKLFEMMRDPFKEFIFMPL